MSQRIDRVDELLRQEIGAILTKDVQDPHIGFATVTDVETTPDLSHAKVWVSVIGTSAERRETLAALERAMAFVRRELGARLRLRRIPALHVALDDAAERGTRVLRILDELGAGDIEGGEAIIDTPRGESLPTPVPRVRRDGDAPDPIEPPGGPPETPARPRRPGGFPRHQSGPPRHRAGAPNRREGPAGRSRDKRP